MAYVPPAPSQLKKTEEGIIVYITVQPNLYPGATTAFLKKKNNKHYFLVK